MTLTFLTPGGWALAAAGVAAGAAAAWFAWSRAPLGATTVRAAIAALRGALVLALFLLLADPSLTRDVERRPLLRVVWDEGAALDALDALDGASRREALASALARARDDLERRFEVVESPSDRPAEATLLLSDGQAERAEALEGRVVALVAARDAAVPDLAIVGATAPARAAPGSAVAVAVTVRALGAAGRTAIVTVADASRVLGSASVEVASPDETLSLELQVVPQSAGMQRLAVEVAGVTGEAVLENNRAGVWIDLDAPVRRVLFVEGEPTWEGKFVRRALEADPTLRVDYVARVSKAATLAQPEVAAGASAGAAGAPPDAARWDELREIVADRRRLFAYDAVILGPLEASLVGEQALSRLAEFVDVRGGGLVVLGANGFAGSVLAARGPLAGALPAAVPASSLARREGRGPDERDPGARGTVLLEPAETAAARAVFAQLGGEASGPIAKLQRLSADYLRLGQLRPGAEAIALDSGSRAVLVAGQPYGAGRTVLVAPADTWRLAIGAPAEAERVASQLWSGIVSWAAAGAEPPSAVRLARPSAVAGEPAQVELVVRDEGYGPVTSASVEATARLAEPESLDAPRHEVALAFSPVPDAPGAYRATFVPPAAGTWVVEARADARSERAAGDGVSARFRVTAPDSGDRLRPDPARAARFEAAVRARGGEVIAVGAGEPDEAARLLAALGEATPRRESATTRAVESPVWAFALPLLFCAEIFLRRRYGAE